MNPCFRYFQYVHLLVFAWTVIPVTLYVCKNFFKKIFQFRMQSIFNRGTPLSTTTDNAIKTYNATTHANHLKNTLTLYRKNIPITDSKQYTATRSTGSRSVKWEKNASEKEQPGSSCHNRKFIRASSWSFLWMWFHPGISFQLLVPYYAILFCAVAFRAS